MSKRFATSLFLTALLGAGLLNASCGSKGTPQGAGGGSATGGGSSTGGGGVGGGTGGGAGGGTSSSSSSSTGGPPDTIVCAPGTYEFPVRSGTCIDDPCDPDPCGGTGSCDNVTGVAVCTPCTLFVDATAGVDTHDGKSPATAWQTLAKVGATTRAAGDNVCFKRGESFFGGITVGQSGTAESPIRYGSYGASAEPKPLVTGFVSLTGWTPTTTGVWKASCAACGSAVNMVAIGGAMKPMGRTPNRSAPNGGYATYDSVIGPSNADAGGYYSTPYAGTLAIVDSKLPASPSWTGAEVVVRKVNYVMDRAVVTSHAGSTIQYQNPMKPAGYTGLPGWGYFFQNSLATLDEPGEWYYDPTTHELHVFFGAAGPGSAVVEASAVDTLLAVKARTDIAVDGIAFRGANGVAVDLNQAQRVTLTRVEVSLAGKEGVVMSGTAGVTLRNSLVDGSNDTGVLVQYDCKDTVVQYNVIQKSGLTPGAGARLADADDGNYSGIQVSGGTVDQNALIDTNVIDQTGFNGVHFVASGVTVKNNLITNFTLMLDDGGGIYTWRGPEVYVNRKIVGNIVLDGPGCPDGKAPPAPVMSSCIYLDNASSNIEVTGNTMARCSRSALLENYARDVGITGNTAFDSPIQAEVWSLAGAPIVNNTSTDNVFFSTTDDQPTMIVAAESGQIPKFGAWDHNFYVRPTQNDLSISVTVTGAPHAFDTVASWHLASGLDAASSESPVVLKPYGAPTLIGGNLVKGGDFEAGIGGFTVWSATSNTTAAADTTGKLTGTGSLKLSFATPKAQSTLIYTGAPGLGAVSSAKSYLLRVSTLGSTVGGVVTATIRQTASPYADLAPAQSRSMGTSRVDHEILLVGPKDDPAATVVIGVDERSGTTWLDGIEVYEVTAPPVKVADRILFAVNARTTPKTVTLGGTYVDAKNASYPGSITLAPFSSAVLMQPEGP